MSRFNPPPPILTATLIQTMNPPEFVGTIVGSEIETYKNKFALDKQKQRISSDKPIVEVKSEKDGKLYRLVLNTTLYRVLFDTYGHESETWYGTRIVVNVVEKVIKSGESAGELKAQRVLKIIEFAPTYEPTASK